ncbi:MAG: hypothetical protein GXP35_01955 [Actinobacteria bacterium]|nr:hypothetical protein [Actinomycetota bacterium]
MLVALIATSCTNSTTDANDAQFDGEGLPRVEDTTAPLAEPDFALDLTATPASEDSSQIVFVLPERRIVSDGGSIREVDNAGNELVLAIVSPLEMGTDPAEAERFGRIDVGPGRLVLAEVLSANQTTSIVLFSRSVATTIGVGAHPGVDADGRFVVFAQSAADGSLSAVTKRSLDGSVLGEFTAAGPIIDITIDPTTGQVGVLHEVGRARGLTIIDATAPALVERSSVAVSGDAEHIAFVGENKIALGTWSNGSAAVSIIDIVGGSIVSQAGLDSEIADLDWSASGDVGLVVTVDGAVLWLAGNATGQLTESGVAGGRW